MQEDKANVKIVFKYHSDMLGKEVAEAMWAKVLDEEKGLYKLDSIPFYGALASLDDIVHATLDEESKMLVYQETTAHSGNSTVQVAIMNEDTKIARLIGQFEALGCACEELDEKFFVMTVPAEVEYENVRKELIDLENSEFIEYAEPCLAEAHEY